MLPRTDLAMEAKELFERSAGEQTRLSGVLARETDRRGVRMTLVRILDAEGEQALGKPRGTYITAELDALARREPGSFAAAARTIGRALRELLGPCRQALVVGLGNREITPDAIGPEAVRNLIVTRHLGSELPEALTGLTSVAACQPGVLGQTGIESLALVKSAMQTAQPDVVIVIDALAAAEPGRLFRTVQLTDTGIVPGSGVGGRADGDGRGGRAAARAHARHAAGAAGHAAGCGRAGAGNGTSGRLRLRSGAAPRALACRDPDVFVVKTRNIVM